VTASNQVKLKPGDTIGILGGGQLGRMLAMAAARLGLRCQVFSPDPDSPAFDVVLNATCADYADVEALELFANDVDVITYEFENVPAASAMILAARRPVLPNRKILETTQDRLAEKDFVKRLGIGTADYADVSSAAALRAAIGKIGLPAVIKTRRFGYDGKGQAIIRDGDDSDQVWEDLGTKSAILEAFIAFEREVSVIAARSADGHVEYRRVPSRSESQTRWIMSAYSRSRCSWCRMAADRRYWSTRSRRECTIPGTGRWTVPPSRSSSSTSAPLPAGRSAGRSVMARSP
jgi:5-(carboxyamino)imidazole ribonucleotide synthase